MLHSRRKSHRRRSTALITGLLMMLLGAILAGGAVGTSAAPAAQQDCDVNNLPDDSATVSPKCGPPGTTFLLTISGFQANEPISFWFTNPEDEVEGETRHITEPHPGSIEDLPIETAPGTAGPTFTDGIWAVTFQGATSDHRAIGRFRIGDAPAQPTAEASPTATSTAVLPTVETASPTVTIAPQSPTAEPASPTTVPVTSTPTPVSSPVAPTETTAPAQATATPPLPGSPTVAPPLPPSPTTRPTEPLLTPTEISTRTPTPTRMATAHPPVKSASPTALPGMPRTGGGNYLPFGLLLVVLGFLLAGWNLSDRARHDTKRL